MRRHTPAGHPCPPRPVASPATVRLLLGGQLAFVAALIIPAWLFRHTPEFATFSITFVSIFLEALPFVLLGAMTGGFIEVFGSRSFIARIVPQRSLPAVMLAAGMGMVFPVCECAIVPVVRRLYAKGLPLGAGIAYLLGGPIVNPLVALSTAVAYGNDPYMAARRLAYGYVIAVLIGLLIDRCFSPRTALLDDSDQEPPMAVGPGAHPVAALRFSQRITLALHHGAGDFIDIARFLVFGAVAAGALQTVLVRGELNTLLASTPLSVLAMMMLAVSLSLCSEADAFVAASLRTILPMAAQMAFMVLGPMLDLKLIAMYFRLFRRRLVAGLALATFGAVYMSIMVVEWVAG